MTKINAYTTILKYKKQPLQSDKNLESLHLPWKLKKKREKKKEEEFLYKFRAIKSVTFEHYISRFETGDVT